MLIRMGERFKLAFVTGTCTLLNYQVRITMTSSPPDGRILVQPWQQQRTGLQQADDQELVPLSPVIVLQ
jgi:hypothetical protein